MICDKFSGQMIRQFSNLEQTHTDRIKIISVDAEHGRVVTEARLRVKNSGGMFDDMEQYRGL